MAKITGSSYAEGHSPVLRAAWLLGQTYGITLLGLVVGIFSARGLNVADRGTLALFLLIVQFSSRVSTIGFEQIILKNGADLKLISFYASAIIGALATIPILLFGISMTNNFLALLPIFVITVAAVAILRINVSFLIFNGNLSKLTVLNFGQTICQLALYAIVFRFSSLLYFLLSWMVNVILFSLISVFIIKGSINFNLSAISLHNIFNNWRDGAKYSSVALPEMAISFCLELPIIKLTLGGVESGLYAISNTLTGIYYQLFASISAIFAKRGKIEIKLPLYAILMGACVAIILIARPAITLIFGHTYADAANFASIMLIATFFLGISRVELVMADVPLSSSAQIGLFFVLAAIMGISLLAPRQYVVYVIGLAYTVYAILSMIFIRIPQFTEKKLAGI